jgi:hypothetical protein
MHLIYCHHFDHELQQQFTQLHPDRRCIFPTGKVNMENMESYGEGSGEMPIHHQSSNVDPRMITVTWPGGDSW